MKVSYMIMTVAAAMALQGCSDWDDHYDSGMDGNATTSNMTLWEEIDSREDLSNFAQLLKRVGYDKALGSNQSYTVWAPTNQSLDIAKYDAMSDSLLKAELINNHIARGYHRATGSIDERIYLLNKKVMDFKGDGTYNIGGIQVASPNQASKNGIIHVLDNVLDFRPNFYDYFSRSQQDGFSTTALEKIFKSNQVREMDLDNSVVGPMKDGQITYLDTVYLDRNYMFETLNTKLSTEDSSYTMIMPTDEAWEKAKAKMVKYYNYPNKIQPFTYDFKEKEPVYSVSTYTDVKSRDSIVNATADRVMLSSLIYSNTINPCLKDEGQPNGNQDSIRSTCDKVVCNTLDYKGMAFPSSDAADLFVGATKKTLSNGVAWVTDSLRFKPWDFGCPLICLHAVSGGYQAANANVARTQVVRVTSDDRNPAVEGSLHGTSYYKVAASQNLRPTLYFYVPGIMKTKYAVYLSMVPENIDDDTKTPETQTLQIKYFRHTSLGKAPGVNGKLPNPSNLKGKSGVKFEYGTQEQARVVTKYMGEFEPNFCYKGLPSTPTTYPMFALSATAATTIPSKTKQIVMGVANIILVPMDAVNYYMNTGVITDYKDEMPELFWHLNMETY